jgi:hypothetical protein
MKASRIPAGLFLGMLLTLRSSCPAAGLSDIKGKDLTGADFDLFETASKKPALVLIGFSKAAGDRCEVWGKALWADAGGDSRVAILSLVMLSQAPGFVRPFIRHAIRKGTPAERQSSTIIVVDRALAWEEHFASDLKADPDQCFVLGISGEGRPSCETVGPFSLERLKALRTCLTPPPVDESLEPRGHAH